MRLVCESLEEFTQLDEGWRSKVAKGLSGVALAACLAGAQSCDTPQEQSATPQEQSDTPRKVTQDSTFIADSLSNPAEHKFIKNIINLTDATVDSIKTDHGMKSVICSLPISTATDYIDLIKEITKDEEIMEYNDWQIYANNSKYSDVHVTFYINGKPMQLKVRELKSTNQTLLMFFT